MLDAPRTLRSTHTRQHGFRCDSRRLQRMNIDPDIVAEQSETGATAVAASVPPQRVPLNVVRQAHAANAVTRRLVEDVGLAKLEAFTTLLREGLRGSGKLDAFIDATASRTPSACGLDLRGSRRTRLCVPCGRQERMTKDVPLQAA